MHFYVVDSLSKDKVTKNFTLIFANKNSHYLITFLSKVKHSFRRSSRRIQIKGLLARIFYVIHGFSSPTKIKK